MHMRKTFWVLLFITVLVTELVGIQLGNRSIDLLCKPLLMVLLGGYFISKTRLHKHGLKLWVLFALFFSWGGDVLLLFQDSGPIFFLLGLSAFLLAHIFYIVFFHRIRIRENIKGNAWLLLLVVIYYGILITILSPHLGSMKLPVRVYGIVISFMFMLAMHMLSIRNRRAGKLMMTGALLFVVSDSLLAINKFYAPFDYASVLIMLTYGFAQLLIIEGAIRYIRSINSK
jgi:uncharacterized membrane protein YhhN